MECPTPFLDNGLDQDTVIVHLGPQTAITDATCCRPVWPMKLSPFQMPNIDPTAKLVSMIDEPSNGSNATD